LTKDLNNMPTQPIHVSQGLAGTQPYGSVQGVETSAILPYYIQPGTEPAFPSGNKFEGKQGVCVHIGEDGMQCRGPRAKQTDFCIGHLRKIEKALKAKEELEAKQEENK
jgi:hypothetical protein